MQAVRMYTILSSNKNTLLEKATKKEIKYGSRLIGTLREKSSLSCKTKAGVHITGKIIEMKKQPVKKTKAPVKVAEAKPKVTRTKANAFSVNLTEGSEEYRITTPRNSLE